LRTRRQLELRFEGMDIMELKSEDWMLLDLRLERMDAAVVIYIYRLVAVGFGVQNHGIND
jgi:hypothetical protein